MSHLRLAIIGLLLTVLSGSFLHADSVLNFPRATFVQGKFTGFAIANPTDTEAEVTLTAYRTDGTLFSSPGVSNPAKLTIRRRQQKAFLLTDADIFSAPPALVNSAEPVRLWLQATSPISGLTGFYLTGDTSLLTLDGSEPSGGLADALLLLLDEGNDTSTDLKLINPGNNPAAVTVEFRRSNGTVAATSTLTLAAKAALQGKASEIFPNRPPDTAYIRFKSDTALAVDALVENTRNPSIAVLSGQRTAAQSRILNFPQLADGGDWFSEIAVVNVSDKTLIVIFRAFKEDGSLFQPPELTNNTVQQSLPPGAILRQTAAQIFGFRQQTTQVGWLQVEGSDIGLTGYVTYGTRSTASRALVAAQHVPLARAIFSHQAEAAGFFTGLAVLNASALTANVEVSSFNADGSLRGTSRQAFKPNQRESKLLRQWVPAAEGAAGGYILVQSDMPVISTELFGTGTLTAIANVPPQPMPTAVDPAPSIPKLKVSPPMAVVEAKTQQQFQAQGLAGVTWSVDVAGGSGAGGSVNPGTGLYTAPDKPPDSRTVTLVATAADGSQKAGATVDVTERKTLASGLSVVRAVTYLTGSKRFFLAEQQSGSSSKISEQRANTTQLLITINDTVEKMLPFLDRRGKELLLLAGFDKGVIYRFDPDAPQQPPVAVITGLQQPTSMAFTETGDLAVAEQGANQIQIIPRSRLDSAKTNSPEVRRAVPAASPQGVAVDTCSGEIFYTDSKGNLIGALAGQTRVLASGLLNPTEILILRRAGMRCPNGITVFIVEEGGNRVLCIAPQVSPAPLVFLSNLNAPRDLTFLPQGNNFADDPNQASISVSDLATVQQVQVSKLYNPIADPVVPAVDPDTVKGLRTVTISGSSSLTIRLENGQVETISLTLDLTATGVTFVDGKFFPSANVFFDVGGAASTNFGALSGTFKFTSTQAGRPPEEGSFTFNGQKILAVADRTKGVGALINFDFSYLPGLANVGPTRIRALDASAPIILAVFLTGADLKTVDAIGGGENRPDGGDIGTAYLRSGGIIAGCCATDEQILNSTSNFTVTIR